MSFASLWKNLSARSWTFLSIGLTGLLLTYLGEVLEPFAGYVDRFEIEVFKTLNQTLGISRAWDWTLFTGASPAYLFVMIGLASAAMFSEAWDIRKINYGRMFGYILFCIAITAGALELADNISDLVKRPSPWNLYQEQMKDEMEQADFIDFDKREGVPDEKVTAASCLFFLLALTLPRAALLTALLLAYYLLCQLALGTQWVVTQVISVCFGAVIAGVSYLAFRGPLHWIEEKSEEAFLSLFWRSIHGGILPKNRAAIQEQPTFPAEQWQKIGLRRLLGKEKFWRDVVRRDVLPVLGAREASYQLDSKPHCAIAKEIRPSRFVRFIHLENGEIVVIKALRRVGGALHRSSRINRYAKSAKNSLKLERFGLPVPRMYWVEDRIANFGTCNFFLSLEEFIQGRPIDPLRSEECLPCMQLLSRLHGTSRDRWGAISDHRHRRRSQYVLHYLRPFVMRNLRKVQRITQAGLTDEDMNRVWKAFEENALTTLADPAVVFRLIHGDVTTRNFLITEKSDIRMIDFVTVRYDLAAGEIIKASIALSDGTSESCLKAWTHYFECAGEERWKEFLKEGRLSLALYALRELAQGRAGLGRKVSISHDAIMEWLTGLFRIESGIWGDSPGDTDWKRILQILRGSEIPPANAS